MLNWIADSEPPSAGVMATDIQIFAKDTDRAPPPDAESPPDDADNNPLHDDP